MVCLDLDWCSVVLVVVASRHGGTTVDCVTFSLEVNIESGLSVDDHCYDGAEA